MSNNVADRVAGYVLAIAMLAGSSAARAQTPVPFTPKQCSDALSIATAIVEKNTRRISSDLRESFVRFGRSKCDLGIDWKLVGKADEDIFGEFRVRLIALRGANSNR